jgi:[acyl-carrier-protein] S-malonyltransferase
MEPAREELAAAIEATTFSQPTCPVYQNVVAAAVTDPAEIQKNLVAQLTAPVRWTQTMHAMIADGAAEVIEVGPGKVLQGLFKKVDRHFPTSSAELEA